MATMTLGLLFGAMTSVSTSTRPRLSFHCARRIITRLLRIGEHQFGFTTLSWMSCVDRKEQLLQARPIQDPRHPKNGES